jgi:C-terminal processing protease CtpA/Prc
MSIRTVILFLFLLVLVNIIAFSFLPAARTDTVYMKDGQEKKGVVVENYHDRIVLSTADGEIRIKKQYIKDILYDRQEQNLIKLGDFHQRKGNTSKAYEYYERAYQLNPDYKEARDKYMHIRSVLARHPEKQLREDMGKRQHLFTKSGKAHTSEAKNIPQTAEERFEKSTGLVLVSENEMPKVKKVLDGSPAQIADIKSGDIIVSVWGRATGYIDMDMIYDMIINSNDTEVKLSVKRRLTPDWRYRKGLDGASAFGLLLDIKEEGLTIYDVSPHSPAAVLGLSAGDLIIAINNQPTRYMTLKEARQSFNELSSLEILRDITLWKNL